MFTQVLVSHQFSQISQTDLLTERQITGLLQVYSLPGIERGRVREQGERAKREEGGRQRRERVESTVLSVAK